MAIEVIISIVAFDEARGVKSTREECVEVPGKVLKLYEVLGGDENEILKRVGDTVFSAALREMQAGNVDMGAALAEAGGGRIGGRGDAAPVVDGSPPPAQPAKADPLREILGLDIVENQIKQERAARQQSAAGPPQRQQPQPPQMGPGPVGFPAGR